MSRWKYAVVLIPLTVVLFVGHRKLCCNAAEIRQLPHCQDPVQEDGVQGTAKSLVFVSTLDGKISALDATNRGTKIWSVDLNPGPLLSSNIHKRDLNSNGQWVKLIPSLRGSLYKFDGDHLEPVPVSVDQLLQSSFRYSDDLIFSGGKKLETYGVSTKTGKILYSCRLSKCTNSTEDHRISEEEILIIRRHQHTIRASEPRSGMERWNFSVGYNDLTLIPPKSDCRSKREKSTLNLNMEIRAIVPEGSVIAYDRENPSRKLWEYKFDSPIVTLWRDDKSFDDDLNENLREINLFSSNTWDSESDSGPGLYIGMHNRQLYVQENPSFNQLIGYTPVTSLAVKFPWKPHPANKMPHELVPSHSSNVAYEQNHESTTTALSVLYNSEYINGNGFYLYSKDQIELADVKQCNRSGSNNSPSEILEGIVSEEFDASDTPVQVIIVSLWYWWKEVLLISLATAFAMNFILSQKFSNFASGSQDAIPAPFIVERHIIEKPPENLKTVEEDPNYTSRYLTDYEPVDCLGRGGYGVVFVARNKLDDCNYAIKRIGLSNSQTSRERVMREVKALAKLDHHNIVRYFSAWVECPPSGWQEKHDSRWSSHQEFPTSNTFNSDSTSNVDNSVRIDVPSSEPPSVDSAKDAFELNDDLEDSFIQFEMPSDEEAEDENSLVATKEESLCTGDSIIFDASRRKSELNLNLRKRKDSKPEAKMFLYIQMQLCQRLSLREWLKNETSPRNVFKVISIFQQIVDAVHYVHLQGLIHRDLKPSNIFFSFDDKIKIGDFGLVTAMTEGCNGFRTPCDATDVDVSSKIHTAKVGTHLYMSPEQMGGQNYNYKVDIYSLGIILFELLSPFSTEMERINTLTNLRKSIYPSNFAHEYPQEYALLQMMLDNVPENRPTTIGIKDRPPLKNNMTPINSKIDEKWHFELPQSNSKRSSVTNSSGSDSWENVNL